LVTLAFVLLLAGREVGGYQIFIFRPLKDKKPLLTLGFVSVHGEFFGQLQAPSTFPSFNDLSGLTDRWNYGFRNTIYFTDTTFLSAQMVAHDDARDRTKFDWHFSLRQYVIDNLVLILGHDSDHDSDHISYLDGKPFFTNRNYLGFGVPYETEDFYVEAFTWFMVNRLRQEYGLRLGAWADHRFGLHLQLLFQTSQLFSRGQALLGDLIFRFKLAEWFELSAGGGLWQDLETTRLGNKQTFYKLFWGIAVPF
jgi:hypothetical protein